MKSIYLILPISLLLLTTTGSSEPVQDVTGNPVETQYPYYILPSTRGSGGGGVTQGPRNSSEFCPFYVIQEDLEASRGLPVRFKPVNPNDKVLKASTNVNVEFAAATTCVQSTVWRLGGRRRYVESGGVAGSPGVRTVSNWFRVVKEEMYAATHYHLITIKPGYQNHNIRPDIFGFSSFANDQVSHDCVSFSHNLSAIVSYLSMTPITPCPIVSFAANLIPNNHLNF
ncbi:uncharacterized protein [Phyllobates terribilis]|uniref:uncharacterized protein n=1 Tax=Phyllobates terribilis TaxID=111132 RepID=UPI003CCAA4A9